MRVAAGTAKRRKSGGGVYTMKIYATHGFGGGRRPGAKINQMQATYEWIDADVVIAGHVHDGSIRIIPSYTVQASGSLALVKRPRIMYRAPSFIQRSIPGVVTYAGRKGYPSTDDGLQYVRIDPQEHRAVRYECDIA